MKNEILKELTCPKFNQKLELSFEKMNLLAEVWIFFKKCGRKYLFWLKLVTFLGYRQLRESNPTGHYDYVLNEFIGILNKHLALHIAGHEQTKGILFSYFFSFFGCSYEEKASKHYDYEGL